MAKILVKKQNVFCDSLGATGNIAQFGSMKAAAAAYSKDPDTIQALAAFAAGWTGAVSSGPPYIEDLNGLFHLLTNQLAYLNQAGIPEYNASETYYIGSLVNDGSGNIYILHWTSATGKPLTNRDYWIPFISSNVIILSSINDFVEDVGYTITDNYIRNVVVNVALTSTRRKIWLPASGVKPRTITIKSLFSSGSTIRVYGSGGYPNVDGTTYVEIALLGADTFFSDGANGWYSI